MFFFFLFFIFFWQITLFKLNEHVLFQPTRGGATTSYQVDHKNAVTPMLHAPLLVPWSLWEDLRAETL